MRPKGFAGVDQFGTARRPKIFSEGANSGFQITRLEVVNAVRIAALVERQFAGCGPRECRRVDVALLVGKLGSRD